MHYYKYLIFIFVLLLVSCEKEADKVTDEPTIISDQLIQPRTSEPTYTRVNSDNCGRELLNEIGLYCFPERDTTLILQTSHGCNVEATITIEECYDPFAPGTDFYFFISLKDWNFITPLSNTCKNWVLGVLSMQSVGQQNSALDDYIDEIEELAQDEYVEWWINYHGAGPAYNLSSTFFEAPCVQRCWATYTDYFIIEDTPCAEYGCCMSVISYVVDKFGNISKQVGTPIQLAECKNPFQVQCRVGQTLGDCRDLGCN